MGAHGPSQTPSKRLRLVLPAPPTTVLRASRHRRAFTLIELLAVIAVMVLMLGLLIPVVKGPGDSQKIRSAADTLAGLAAQARLHSLNRNTYTALVIPTQAAPAGRGLRTAALYELQMRPDGSPATASDWKQITPWLAFMEGAVLNDKESTFFDPPTRVPSPELPTQIKTPNGNTTSYAYQVYLPNGRLLNPETVTLKVIAGTLQGGELTPTSDQANYVLLSLISTTGQVQYTQP